MASLLALAAVLIVLVVGGAIAATVAVSRDRARRRGSRVAKDNPADLAAGEVAGESVDSESAADFMQFWMDNEWNQRFG